MLAKDINGEEWQSEFSEDKKQTWTRAQIPCGSEGVSFVIVFEYFCFRRIGTQSAIPHGTSPRSSGAAW
jgi:hypothetical protein